MDEKKLLDFFGSEMRNIMKDEMANFKSDMINIIK